MSAGRKTIVLCIWSCFMIFAPIMGIHALGADDPQVEFNHANPAWLIYTIEVSDRETITILIKNTLPDHFSYEVAGLPVSTSESLTRTTFRINNVDTPMVTDKTIPLIHDKRYGGYIVRIKSNTGNAVKATIDGKTQIELKDQTFVIAVKENQWNIDFAGAFTINSLTDPVFYLQSKDENGESTQVVVEDSKAQDSVRLGVGAFIHLYHDRLPYLAASFGLGVNQGNRVTYYLGPSWRFSGKAALTTGVALGSINRLPAGVTTGSLIADPNALNNLPTRIDEGWFFSISYGFLGSKEPFQKPIAGEK
jgi:hypothetical protein